MANGNKRSFWLMIPAVFLLMCTIVHLICTYRYIDYWEGGFDYATYLSGVNQDDQLRIAAMYNGAGPGTVSQMFPRDDEDDVLGRVMLARVLDVGSKLGLTSASFENAPFLTAGYKDIKIPNPRSYIVSTLLSAGPMLQTFTLFLAAFPAGPVTMVYALFAVYFSVKSRALRASWNVFLVFTCIVFALNTIQFGFACRLLQYARKVNVRVTKEDMIQFNTRNAQILGAAVWTEVFPSQTSYLNDPAILAQFSDVYTKYVEEVGTIEKGDSEVRLAPLEYGMAVITILQWIFCFIYAAVLGWTAKSQGKNLESATSMSMSMPPPPAITDVKIGEESY
eukprot:tig00000704_g3352.t1